MTTKQPEALRLANVCSNLTRYSMDAHLIAAELRTQLARITELESQLAQRFDAAAMATASASGFRDGAASAALASAPAQAAEPSITLDFKMATDMLGMFCGEPGLVTLQRGDEHCHSGPGLYAWYSDMPEEGAGFLGAEPDDEATPSAPSATAQPVAEQGAAYAALPTSSYAGRVYEEGFLIGTCPLYAADQLHAFADATHTLRASHGEAPATQQAGIPGNFITHRAAWREALETAKFVSTGVDRSYWDHELAAFDRSFDRLWTLMQDAPRKHGA